MKHLFGGIQSSAGLIQPDIHHLTDLFQRPTIGMFQQQNRSRLQRHLPQNLPDKRLQFWVGRQLGEFFFVLFDPSLIVQRFDRSVGVVAKILGNFAVQNTQEPGGKLAGATKLLSLHLPKSVAQRIVSDILTILARDASFSGKRFKFACVSLIKLLGRIFIPFHNAGHQSQSLRVSVQKLQMNCQSEKIFSPSAKISL